MNELRGLAILLLMQAAGEAVAHFTRLPIPGPVIGLMLLLIGLQWKAMREPVSMAAQLLLTHLSLLFVPVGVGIIMHLDLVAHHGAQLLAVVAISTWIGMAVTALVLRSLLRREAPGGAGND